MDMCLDSIPSLDLPWGISGVKDGSWYYQTQAVEYTASVSLIMCFMTSYDRTFSVFICRSNSTVALTADDKGLVSENKNNLKKHVHVKEKLLHSSGEWIYIELCLCLIHLIHLCE